MAAINALDGNYGPIVSLDTRGGKETFAALCKEVCFWIAACGNVGCACYNPTNEVHFGSVRVAEY
jgi:hypothetical protein